MLDSGCPTSYPCIQHFVLVMGTVHARYKDVLECCFDVYAMGLDDTPGLVPPDTIVDFVKIVCAPDSNCSRFALFLCSPLDDPHREERHARFMADVYAYQFEYFEALAKYFRNVAPLTKK